MCDRLENIAPQKPKPDFSKQPGRNIDRQRDHGGVEEKRQHALHRADPAHLAAGKADVGGLAGRSDNAGEIDEIAVIGRLAAGEIKTAVLALDFRGVVVMRVMPGSAALSNFCQKMVLILLNNFCWKLLNATEPSPLLCRHRRHRTAG